MDDPIWVDAGNGIKIKVGQYEFDETELAANNPIILDWKGIKRNGVEIPYSKEELRNMYEECPDLIMFAISSCIKGPL